MQELAKFMNSGKNLQVVSDEIEALIERNEITFAYYVELQVELHAQAVAAHEDGICDEIERWAADSDGYDGSTISDALARHER